MTYKFLWTHNSTDAAYNIHQDDGNRECVAAVWTAGYQGAEDNARELASLFAAAPDLLAALKRAEQYLELALMEEAAEDPHSTSARNAGDDLDTVRAAIAKATAK